MTRVYHPWFQREDCAEGMWRNVNAKDRESFTAMTAELMAFPVNFERAMLRALDEWPNSTEAALTSPSMNHQAWLGRAGCFLATGSPEDATRLGWHKLDGLQQWEANAAADRVITEWKRRRRLHILGGQYELPLEAA